MEINAGRGCISTEVDRKQKGTFIRKKKKETAEIQLTDNAEIVSGEFDIHMT